MTMTVAGDYVDAVVTKDYEGLEWRWKVCDEVGNCEVTATALTARLRQSLLRKSKHDVF